MLNNVGISCKPSYINQNSKNVAFGLKPNLKMLYEGYGAVHTCTPVHLRQGVQKIADTLPPVHLREGWPKNPRTIAECKNTVKHVGKIPKSSTSEKYIIDETIHPPASQEGWVNKGDNCIVQSRPQKKPDPKIEHTAGSAIDDRFFDDEMARLPEVVKQAPPKSMHSRGPKVPENPVHMSLERTPNVIDRYYTE